MFRSSSYVGRLRLFRRERKNPQKISGNSWDLPIHRGSPLIPGSVANQQLQTVWERMKDSWNRLSPLACAAICRLVFEVEGGGGGGGGGDLY